MKDWMHSVATGGAILATGFFGPAAVVASYGKEEWADPVLAAWARNILQAAGTTVHVRGLERLPEGTCIFASNHQSNFDPVVILANVPRHVRFVAKAELFRIPFFGGWMKRLGNIRVERSGSEKDRQALAEAVTQVRERVSVLFFPEGTRSADGVLKPFKKGAAMLAIKAQVPLVPMAVAGTMEILPPGSRSIRGGRHAALLVGEPIPTAGLTEQDRESLTERSRQAVAALLDEAQGWLRSLER